MDHQPRSTSPHLCNLCGRRSNLISATLGVCGDCIRSRPREALLITDSAHRETRRAFNLPEFPPRTPGGLCCPLCTQKCVIGEGERGFCGLRTVRNRRLVHQAGTASRGSLQWYRDPLPTNCVADWVCAGSLQKDHHNLAVFYASCTLDCLFCQNWHFREVSPPFISAAELADTARPDTFCVCFFGGDPATQMPHALAAAQQLASKGVAICWETAGTSNSKLLDRAVELSMKTGGCIKFDLKAYNEVLHIALTGTSNRCTLENFGRAARRSASRPNPPLVVASTLLVPGYVDAAEVGRIARLIADIDRGIPYSLLGFAPHFKMADLPQTSVRHAREAEAAARAAGLTRVHIGNRHLLSGDY